MGTGNMNSGAEFFPPENFPRNVILSPFTQILLSRDQETQDPSQQWSLAFSSPDGRISNETFLEGYNMLINQERAHIALQQRAEETNP